MIYRNGPYQIEVEGGKVTRSNCPNVQVGAPAGPRELLIHWSAAAPVLRPARFQLDLLGDRQFEGWSDGRSWNGFACPYFDYTQASAVMRAMASAGRPCCYHAESDAFRFYDQTQDAVEEFAPVVIDRETYYQIGSGSWCWAEAEEESHVNS